MISIKGFGFDQFHNNEYYINIIVDDLKDNYVTILGMITNKNNVTIDAFKHHNMICSYCQKSYLRYGAYMKHIETCKHKFNSNHKINVCKIPQESNQELLNSMNNEINNLRNEVCELRRLISVMVNQEAPNKVESVPNVPDTQNTTTSPHKVSKIKIIDNTCPNILKDIEYHDCDIEFDVFLSRLDFCNQSQLLDIFDSDDLKDSFFFLWNEALNKLKYNNIPIPMKYKNRHIIIFEKGMWNNLEIYKIEKMVSYLHDKIVQQLSIYQTTPKIKSRIENEASFRDYYLNQVTKINSDKLLKSLKNNSCEFIDHIGHVLI